MPDQPNLFDRFGGTRKMAEALNEPPSTVQSWKSVGRIPAGKQPDVLAAAERLGIPITAEDVIFPMGRSLALVEADGSANSDVGNSCGGPGVPHGPFVRTSSGMNLSEPGQSDDPFPSSTGTAEERAA
jgi:hypothetical protein